MKITNSSTIDEVVYDPPTKVMRVTFKSGHTYDYHDVNPEIHDNFIRAESPGKFHAWHIKTVHRFSKAHKTTETKNEKK